MSTLNEPLSIRQLEVFVALVDQGSFTRAARALGLSQSTVSGHAADLERRVGAEVVERDRRGVTPTAAGQALLAPARETLLAERASRAAVEELTGLLRGRLVVGGSTIPATYLLPALLARFHQMHPEIALRLWTGDSRDVLERVQDAELEVGLVGAEPDVADLQAVPVASDRLVLVVPPGHALADRTSVSAADVLAEPLVLREEGSGTRAAALAVLQAGGAGAELRVVCEVGSTEAQKSAVRAGLGVTLVSDFAVREELAAGTLVDVPLDGTDAARPFFLVTRKDGYLGPAARAFVDLVRGDAPLDPR